MVIRYEDVRKADRRKPPPTCRDRAFWDEFARLMGRALEAQRKAREAAEQERLAWWC